MAKKIVIHSENDNHVLFSCFMSYYSETWESTQLQKSHRHSELEISAVMSGSGVYNCAGREYSFRTGDIFFHCGNDVHYFSSIDGKIDLSLVVLRFDPRLIWSPSGEWTSPQFLRLFASETGLDRKLPGETETAKTISGLLVKIFEECQGQAPAYDAFVKAELMMILACLSRHFDGQLKSSSVPRVAQCHIKNMEESMSYILSHLDSELSLDKLAARACMSRSYYSSIFKALNGISVGEYISCQRIDRAKYKLKATDQPVLEIAGSCGFNSIANFNRSFKMHTGKTPGEYRAEVSDSAYLHI